MKIRIHLLSLSFISVRKHPLLLGPDACSFSACAMPDAVCTDPPGKWCPASAWCCPCQLGTDAQLVLMLPTPLDAWCFLGSGAATSEVPSSEQQCFQTTKNQTTGIPKVHLDTRMSSNVSHESCHCCQLEVGGRRWVGGMPPGCARSWAGH